MPNIDTPQGEQLEFVKTKIIVIKQNKIIMLKMQKSLHLK